MLNSANLRHFHVILYNKKQPEYTDARGRAHTHTYTPFIRSFFIMLFTYIQTYLICGRVHGRVEPIGKKGVNISYQNYRRYETRHFRWYYLLQINFLCNSFHGSLDRILFAWYSSCNLPQYRQTKLPIVLHVMVNIEVKEVKKWNKAKRVKYFRWIMLSYSS